MLSWDKIDNDKTFQRLINHLFALECNSPGFIPSSPYIGADGAWDGYYEGIFPPEQSEEEGIWSIQAKWTKKSFDKAMPYLKTEIKKEIQNAKSNKADHLRMATNAQLRVNQVKELEKLGKGEIKTLRIWHREELTRRIELQPFLRSYFFEGFQRPKFVPFCIYFNEIERRLLPISATRISRFKDYVAKIKSFLLSDDKNILLISANGGHGKSHLLREIREFAHRIDESRQFFMVRPEIPEIKEAMDKEIMEGKNYLLVLDDADRDLEEIKPLLSLAKQKGSSIKIILALRKSGFLALYNIVRGTRCEENYDVFTISKWSTEELVQLLREAAKQKVVEDERMIATLYLNPFIVVWIGKRLRGEKTLAFNTLKEKFINDIEIEAEKCLKGMLQKLETLDFIKNLCCVVPFSANDQRIHEVLAKEFNVETSRVRKILSELREAGILRIVGNSYRFDPDMKGDFYLADSLGKNEDTSNLEGLLRRWIPVSADKFFINLGASLQYCSESSVKEIISGIIDSWVEDAERISFSERRKRLDFAEKIAYFVPEECLNLIDTLLDLDVSSPTEEQLTTDDYGPIMLTLLGITSVREDVINIMQRLKKETKEGHYDNYKLGSLAERAVSPIYNKAGSIFKTLEIMRSWLDKPDKDRIFLVSSALGEVLSASHEYTKSIIGGLALGEKCLSDTKEVREIRNKAMVLVKEMINSPSVEIKLAAIKIAGRIGDTKMGRITEEHLPLANKIAKERQEVVKELEKLVSEDDFRILNEVENFFLIQWLQEKPSEKEAMECLRKLRRSPEYIAFRYFVSPDYVVGDFGSLKKNAPPKNKWSWFVDNFMYRATAGKAEDFQELGSSLDKKYNSKEKLVGFLIKLDKEVSPYKPWNHPPIIGCWMKLRPELFFQIKEDAECWEKVPDRFKQEIDLNLPKFRKKFIDDLANEILSSLPKASIRKVDTFLVLLSEHSVSTPKLVTWLSKLIQRGETQIRNLLVFRLRSICRTAKDTDLFIKLLRMVISTEKGLARIADNLAFAIHYLNRESQLARNKRLMNKLREDLLQKLKNIPKINWHAQELLDFSLTNIESAIDFVDYRFQKIEKIKESCKGDWSWVGKYEAIPFKGIKCVCKLTKSKKDYMKILGAIIKWYVKDVGKRHSLMNLMKPLNAKFGHTYLKEHIEKLCQLNNKEATERALIASVFLPVEEDTISTFTEIGEKAIALKKSKEIRKLFYSKTLPEGGWSSAIGKVSPALLKKKELFQKIRNNAKSGQLKVLTKRCIKWINSWIEDEKERDEEFLNPRG